MNKIQVMEQFGRAIQMFAQSLTNEEQALEIATLYPKFTVGKSYVTNEYFTFGENSVGDPQLYKVVQNHTSQSDWIPSETPSLYVPVGLNDNGYPIWSKPSGAHDAYNIGDIVEYNEKLYKSIVDGNVYSPDEYPSGWEVITDE